MRIFSLSAGVACRTYSQALQRAMVDFGADDSFAEAVKKMKEHYRIEVPESALRSLTHQHAQTMLEEQELESELGEGGVDLLIAQLDGSLVPIVTLDEAKETDSKGDRRKMRKLEWKEARLSMVRRPEEVSKLYNATMRGVELAGEQLLDCVIRAGGGKNTHIHCGGDGAVWIVRQVEDKLPGQVSYLVDFYHLSEYLSAAAEAVAGEEKEVWFSQQKERIKSNEVEKVLGELRPKVEDREVKEAEAPIRRCERYLRNRLEYMDYKGAIEAGMPIGTGEVESGHRTVIQERLKLAGAWWKVENAEKMLCLRVKRANGEWESYWERQRQAAA